MKINKYNVCEFIIEIDFKMSLSYVLLPKAITMVMHDLFVYGFRPIFSIFFGHISEVGAPNRLYWIAYTKNYKFLFR